MFWTPMIFIYNERDFVLSFCKPQGIKTSFAQLSMMDRAVVSRSKLLSRLASRKKVYIIMIRAGVLTLSDKGSRGERLDESGKAIKEILAAIGAQVLKY
jgi:hypothetical protein